MKAGFAYEAFLKDVERHHAQGYHPEVGFVEMMNVYRGSYLEMKSTRDRIEGLTEGSQEINNLLRLTAEAKMESFLIGMELEGLKLAFYQFLVSQDFL